MKQYDLPTKTFENILDALTAVIDDLTSAPELLQNRDFREFCEDLHTAGFSASVIVRRMGDRETYFQIAEACEKLAELANL